MTITKNIFAPLVAVVGATGTQGGSVIKALAESDKPYRVRAFTRDSTKPAALELVKLGVDVVAVSLVVENKDEVYKAFVGADVAFLITNFWEHLNMDKEIVEGKLLIDAAKAGGVSRIVWSGLPSISELSGGKYVHVHHVDSKARVTTYGRQSGVPFVDVQAGFYGTNLLASPMSSIMLMKQEDGSFAMPWPVKPTTMVPFIDAARDYGLFVRGVIERSVFPDGSELSAHGEKISIRDMALQLSQATGKNVVFKQITVEQWRQNIQALGVPPHIVLDMVDSFQFFDEFGCQCAREVSDVRLARNPCTWAEFVKATDWSKVLA
ncbi:NAD(P)-binding protein [Mycena epipterygia]|nr:NAD(P)-binding protein [Mycena epipterygia]